MQWHQLHQLYDNNYNNNNSVQINNDKEYFRNIPTTLNKTKSFNKIIINLMLDYNIFIQVRYYFSPLEK